MPFPLSSFRVEDARSHLSGVTVRLSDSLRPSGFVNFVIVPTRYLALGGLRPQVAVTIAVRSCVDLQNSRKAVSFRCLYSC